MQTSPGIVDRASSAGVFLAATSALLLLAGSAHAGEPAPWQVTVKTEAAKHGELPGWAAYKQEAVVFDATLRVVNRSDETKRLWVWSCSWTDNWQLAGKGVGWAPGPCFRNSVHPVTLKPGEAHEQKVVMHFKPGWSADEVAFKVGFTASRPYRGGPPYYVERPPTTYWSEDVTVRASREGSE